MNENILHLYWLLAIIGNLIRRRLCFAMPSQLTMQTTLDDEQLIGVRPYLSLMKYALIDENKMYLNISFQQIAITKRSEYMKF